MTDAVGAMDRLAARIEAVDSLLCIGLDSAYDRLPERFARSAQPQLDFNRAIIDQTADLVAAYKPNLAFYEARGGDGWDELAETMDVLGDHAPDVFAIADAKRGDIASTNEVYAAALFDGLGFDAVTLQPYVGRDSLRPFLDRADRACIILCRTSDPGSGELQDLLVGDEPLWEVVARRVRDEWDEHGNCMLVVGATYPDELRRARELCPGMTFLVPGVGAQGGGAVEVVAAGIDAAGGGLLINASRSVIFSDDPRRAALALRDEIRRARDEAVARGAP
jgi:orotidine-5'-phosphate decarboxylase